MGSSCSCGDKDLTPDDHQTKFKVINVDDDGNELGLGVMELTNEALVVRTHKRHVVRWPYLCLRRYGYDSNLFSFESNRHCQTGQGIFAFKCPRAEEIFNMLQNVMLSNHIRVVEEVVQEADSLPIPASYAVPSVPNGTPRYPTPTFEDTPPNPCSRHPSTGSARLPSVGADSTHPLLGTNDMVHTYVNTVVAQDESHTPGACQHPLGPSLCGPEVIGPHNNVEPRVLLDRGGAKFILGPTPVQRQMMTKEQGQGSAEADWGAAVPCRGGLTGESDTGYDSDDRREPLGSSCEHANNAAAPAHTCHPAVPACHADRVDVSADQQTCPSLTQTPFGVAPSPSLEGTKRGSFALKTLSLNSHSSSHRTDSSHCYINTESVVASLDVPTVDPWRRRECPAPSVFDFDLRWAGLDSGRQLHYIELEMDAGSGSSSPHTPRTPPTPTSSQTPTRRTELYAVIDVERTAAMSSLQRALPQDDGTCRKTRHNSSEVPA